MSPTPKKMKESAPIKVEVSADYDALNDDVIVEYMDYHDYIAVEGEGNAEGESLEQEAVESELIADLRAENDELRKQLEIYQNRESVDLDTMAPVEVTNSDLYTKLRLLQDQVTEQTGLMQQLFNTVADLKQELSSEHTDFVLNFPIETVERLQEVDSQLSSDPRAKLAVRNRLQRKKDKMRSVIADEVLSHMTISRQYANEHTKKLWTDKSPFLMLIKEIIGEQGFITFLSKAHHRYKNRRHYDRKTRAHIKEVAPEVE